MQFLGFLKLFINVVQLPKFLFYWQPGAVTWRSLPQSSLADTLLAGPLARLQSVTELLERAMAEKNEKTQSYLSIPSLPQSNPRSKSKILPTRIQGWNLHPFGLNQGSHRQHLRMLPVPGLLGEALPAPSFGAEEMEYLCRCLRRNTSVPWRWRKGQLD